MARNFLGFSFIFSGKAFERFCQQGFGVERKSYECVGIKVEFLIPYSVYKFWIQSVIGSSRLSYSASTALDELTCLDHPLVYLHLEQQAGTNWKMNIQ